MEHYILYASMIMCIALHYCALSGISPQGTHQLKNSICLPVVIRELRVLDPPYVLTAFMFAGSDLTGMYYQFMWALGQSCIPAFFFIVYVHYMFINVTKFIRFNY